METDNSEPVVVFNGTIWEAEMVKSLLENAEIEAFLNDEINGTMVPWVTAAGGAGSVKVVVALSDFENAKSVVDDFEKNR